MVPIKKTVAPAIILTVVKMVYGSIRVWLWEQAKKSDSPIDDWMLELLDNLLGFSQ